MFLKLCLSSLETRRLMPLHERHTFLLKWGGAVKAASYYLYFIFKLKKWSEMKVTQSRLILCVCVWVCEVAQLCPTLCDPVDCSPPGSSLHGILQARILGRLPFPSPGDLPNPGIEPRSPTLQVDSLPAEPQGKPKNTGVGSLSLLQQIFLIQESNQGLLHCRWTLYQVSYQGSLFKLKYS